MSNHDDIRICLTILYRAILVLKQSAQISTTYVLLYLCSRCWISFPTISGLKPQRSACGRLQRARSGKGPKMVQNHRTFQDPIAPKKTLIRVKVLVTGRRVQKHYQINKIPSVVYMKHTIIMLMQDLKHHESARQPVVTWYVQRYEYVDHWLP